MGRPIVKLGGHYLEWTTVADGPATFGMTLDEFRAYYREKYGSRGAEELPPRLARVEAHGTSSHGDEDVSDTIWLNRAGPGESQLHLEEIVEFYVRRKVNPTNRALTAFRKGLSKCGPSCVAVERYGCAGFCRKCWGTGFVRP